MIKQIRAQHMTSQDVSVIRFNTLAYIGLFNSAYLLGHTHPAHTLISSRFRSANGKKQPTHFPAVIPGSEDEL